MALHFYNLSAHPNARAVFCHGGSGIVHEAVYYGLPVVGIPLFGDHFDNMLRAISKGFAIQLDLLQLTEDGLYRALTQVIHEPRYMFMKFQPWFLFCKL